MAELQNMELAYFWFDSIELSIIFYWMGKHIPNFILTDCLSIITSWIPLFLVPFVIISSSMHTFTHILQERIMFFTKVSTLSLSPQAETRFIEIIIRRMFPEHQSQGWFWEWPNIDSSLPSLPALAGLLHTHFHHVSRA